MYFLYKKEVSGNRTILKSIKQIHLAGSKTGIIVQYLRKIIDKSKTEPFGWHIPVDDLFKKLNLPGNSLIIDANPHSKKELSLFGVINIWGYSSHDWTPILLELKQILADDINKFDRTNFILENYNDDQSVFTFLYLKGSIKDGEIIDKWSFPRPSRTNSVFLWPEALEFFTNSMGYVKKGSN